MKVLFDNKPAFSALLPPSNSSRCCKSLHFSLKGKLRPVPQVSASSRDAVLRTSTRSSRTLSRCGVPMETGGMESSCVPARSSVMPDPRWNVKTLASVPCSQENYNSLWTKDHLFTIEIFSSPILLHWAAEFSKSFCWMKECFLWQQLEQDKCFCGTEIPSPWSRKVVPFPKVEKHFIASGVWESPRRRRVLYSPHSKDSLIASYFPSWGWGGISLSFLSTEQLTKMSPYTWRPPPCQRF